MDSFVMLAHTVTERILVNQWISLILNKVFHGWVEQLFSHSLNKSLFGLCDNNTTLIQEMIQCQ